MTQEQCEAWKAEIDRARHPELYCQHCRSSLNADTPAELRMQMRNHPYCQKYGVYEFPFPARHYIGSLEYAGFRLRSVVPSGWGNNALSSYTRTAGSIWNQRLSKLWRSVFKKLPKLTVLLYRLEDFFNRAMGTRFRWFTRPQMMIFQRVES